MVKDTPRNRASIRKIAMAMKSRTVVKKEKAGVTRRSKAPQPVFGPIATIDTAPVSIGNTVSGSQPVVVPVEDGMRVQGRDFLVKIDNTATGINDWTLVAGAPLAPACMVASTLKHFSNTYAHYLIHGVAFHFITSSSTATDGSIMFYINKDRNGPALPTDSANFMPAVLSDHNTLIGPLWTNSTAKYFPEPRWYPTDVFNSDDLHEQSCGEVLIYTKTGSTAVPGYVLVDYDITFRGLSLNPKTQLLPVSRMKYNQTTFGVQALAVTAGSTNFEIEILGSNLDGTTPAVQPSGTTTGDIYKVYLDTNDATFTNVSTATLLQRLYPTGLTAVEPVSDGYTCYALATTSGPYKFLLFSTHANAMAVANPLKWGVTATVTMRIPVYMSLVGSYGGLLHQASI